jgi:hypothetical protein
VEKGKYAKTDHYVFHALLGNSGKEAIIYTDNRIMLVTKNDMFGQWQVCYKTDVKLFLLL